MNQNYDPISGGSGSHPVGTGVGAAGGAVAGAAIGTAVGGPVGAVVVGAIGAATGALAGQSAAEAVNPTVEDAYWSANYLKRDYVERNRPYTDYRPAYQYGWESRARLGDRPFRDVESDLERGWELARGESKLAWTQAKHAASDAWHRLERAGPVDATLAAAARSGSSVAVPGARFREHPLHTQEAGMRKTAWLAVLAIILSTVAIASSEVAVLDGTSWKVDVEPDAMAKDKGEKQFKETLTFAEGNVSLSAPKVGFWASPYSVSKAGEKDWTFKAERASAGEGRAVWTGTVHGNSLEGKLIWTKNDGSVLTYTFKGNKLD